MKNYRQTKLSCRNFELIPKILSAEILSDKVSPIRNAMILRCLKWGKVTKIKTTISLDILSHPEICLFHEKGKRFLTNIGK